MSWWALLVSSAAFAAIHTTWLGGLLAGVIFGIVQIRFGSLGHAIVAHMVSNAVVTTVVIVFDDLWLWL
jgi:membrane protease YdiL (CAAX protease family)